MKLVDRYVAAIGRELPPGQAEEISAELKDVLLSKIEDREAELERPLSDKEIEQLLIAFGHPLVVAGSYRKVQYLIGPESFPFWLATMRWVLMFGGAIFLVSLIVSAASTNSSFVWVLKRAGQAFWPGFLFVFGGVTLVFAANERMGKFRMQYNWNPRQLPPSRAAGRRRFDMMAEIAAGLVFLLWWTGSIQFRHWLPMPPRIDVHLSAQWAPLHAPIMAFIVAEIAINVLALTRPGWGRLNAGLSLAKNLAGCAILGWVLRGGYLVEVTSPQVSAQVIQSITEGFDRGLRLGVMATIVVLAIKAVLDARRLWLADTGGSAGTGGPAATLHTA